jgi:uncharacterized protein (DUF433 family)
MPATLMPDTLSLPETPAQDRELIPASDPRAGLISINPARLSGTPCFVGTRVPIQNLWDYLEAGEPLSEFLEGFPGVTQEQTLGVMRLALGKLLEGTASR